ncbi:unnamed protein product [Symbiodinium sp. CCMP2592]|nr:unnamed protein product [Symbiodinium sp. CCMP2592]
MEGLSRLDELCQEAGRQAPGKTKDKVPAKENGANGGAPSLDDFLKMFEEEDSTSRLPRGADLIVARSDEEAKVAADAAAPAALLEDEDGDVAHVFLEEPVKPWDEALSEVPREKLKSHEVVKERKRGGFSVSMDRPRERGAPAAPAPAPVRADAKTEGAATAEGIFKNFGSNRAEALRAQKQEAVDRQKAQADFFARFESEGDGLSDKREEDDDLRQRLARLKARQAEEDKDLEECKAEQLNDSVEERKQEEARLRAEMMKSRAQRLAAKRKERQQVEQQGEGLEEERRRTEEERLEAQRRQDEEERLEAERRKAEEERLEMERKQEQEKLQEERRREEERLEAQRREEERLEAQRRQEEEERLEAERRKAEEERLEMERKQEQEKLEEERRREEERLEAQRRQEEEERLEAERRKAEEERLEMERKQEQEKLEEERLEAERRKEEERLEAERRKAEEERLEMERKQEQEKLEEERRREEERLEAQRWRGSRSKRSWKRCPKRLSRRRPCRPHRDDVEEASAQWPRRQRSPSFELQLPPPLRLRPCRGLSRSRSRTSPAYRPRNCCLPLHGKLHACRARSRRIVQTFHPWRPCLPCWEKTRLKTQLARSRRSRSRPRRCRRSQRRADAEEDSLLRSVLGQLLRRCRRDPRHCGRASRKSLRQKSLRQMKFRPWRPCWPCWTRIALDELFLKAVQAAVVPVPLDTKFKAAAQPCQEAHA